MQLVDAHDVSTTDLVPSIVVVTLFFFVPAMVIEDPTPEDKSSTLLIRFVSSVFVFVIFVD